MSIESSIKEGGLVGRSPICNLEKVRQSPVKKGRKQEDNEDGQEGR